MAFYNMCTSYIAGIWNKAVCVYHRNIMVNLLVNYLPRSSSSFLHCTLDSGIFPRIIYATISSAMPTCYNKRRRVSEVNVVAAPPSELTILSQCLLPCHAN
jgi:hypothetical protein